MCPNCSGELRLAKATGIHPYGTQPDPPIIWVCDNCRIKITEHPGIGTMGEDLSTYKESDGTHQNDPTTQVGEDDNNGGGASDPRVS